MWDTIEVTLVITICAKQVVTFLSGAEPMSFPSIVHGPFSHPAMLAMIGQIIASVLSIIQLRQFKVTLVVQLSLRMARPRSATP